MKAIPVKAALTQTDRPLFGDDWPEWVPVREAATALSVDHLWLSKKADDFGGRTVMRDAVVISRDKLNEYLEACTRPARVRNALREQRKDCELIVEAVGATVAAMRWCEKRESLWLDGTLTGFVYFGRTRRDGLVKVGFSTHPVRRLFEHHATHGMLEIVLVIPGSERLEREIHRLFEPYRVRVEWFHWTSRIGAFVKWLRAGLEPA